MKKIFWIFVILSILVHIYAMTFPLATLEDEATHVERSLYMTEILNSFPIILFVIAIPLLILFLCILYKLYQKNENWLLITLVPLSVAYYYIISIIATKFLIHKFNSLDINNLIWMVRYGSIATVVYSLQLIIFGYREWAMRLFPLIFSILSSVYLYKLIKLYKNENWALYSSIILLFMPGVFYFVNISQLTTGIMFFTIASVYYLILYTLNREKKNLVYMSLFLILGSQYKDSFILIYGTIFLYLIYCYFFIKKQLNYKGIIKYSCLSLIPAIIWLITEIIFVNSTNKLEDRFFVFNPTLIHNIFRYIISLPSEATWPITILFLLSIPLAVYLIWKKKDELTFIFLIQFLIIYMFISLDALNNYTTTVYRYGADLLLPVAFLSFIILNYIKQKKILKLLVYSLIIFLIVTSCYLTYSNWENRFVPMDGTFKYIKENIPESSKILKTMAPNPYKFYIAKYNLKQEIKHIVWANASEQNIENLYSFMKKNNYTYFIFPKPTMSYQSYWQSNYSWIYTQRLYLEPVLNDNLLLELNKNNTYFNVIYQENLGPNRLYLIKIN